MKETRQLEVRKKYQDYLLWLLPKINSFPQKQKFILGDKISKVALEILGKMIIIQYARPSEREVLLKDFNKKLEILRDLMRIAWQMNFLSHKAFLHQEAKIDEVGRMVYGLIHSSRKK